MGSIPREHTYWKKCIAWMHCKSLWIKASAKCINVNVRATTHRRVKEFGYSCRIPLVKPLLNHRQRQRCLTWAKEKKNWTVAQWSKVLFSDKSKFCISFGNQGPRVWRKGGEAHSSSCMKYSVKFPQNQRHCTRLPKMFWSTSCFFLLTSFLKMLISFSSRIWHLPTLPKAPKVG